MLKVQSSWRWLGDKKRCRKEGFHGYDNQDVFPLDIDGYFYDSFSYDSTDVLSWLTHLILVHDTTHSSPSFPIYPIIHTMSQMSSLIYFSSYDPFSCVASSFFHGCAIVLTEAAHLTHFLTHIILHAGRIFQQWHHNHNVCLVVKSALHVYKGQFSPWLGQFTNDENSSPVFIGFNSASVKVQSKLDLQIWSVKNSWNFGHNHTISLLTSSTTRSIRHLVKFKSSLHSAYWAYAYKLIGLWNWRKCLEHLHHWHCENQDSECRTSKTSKS